MDFEGRATCLIFKLFDLLGMSYFSCQFYRAAKREFGHPVTVLNPYDAKGILSLLVWTVPGPVFAHQVRLLEMVWTTIMSLGRF